MDALERRFLAAGAVGLAAFALVAILVASGGARPLDEPAARLADAPAFVVDASHVLALVGEFIAVGSAVALALLVLLWLRRWWGAIRLGVVMVANEAVTGAAKILFARPRPLDAIEVEATFAFPSGHAARGAVLAVLVVWFATRQLRGRAVVAGLVAAGASWALAQAAGRLVLRVHYASDVVGGIALGAAVACFALVVSVEAERRWRARERSR